MANNDLIFRTLEREDIKDSSNDDFLNWWSNQTKLEINTYLKPRESAWLRNNLIFAVKVLSGENIVSAAGVIDCVDKYGKKVYSKGKLVVELMGHYIHEDFRKKGIKEMNLSKRIDFCNNRKNPYLPVIVTQSNSIMNFIENDSWKEIDGMDPLFQKIRYCECLGAGRINFIGKRCDLCPMLDRSTWIKMSE